MVQYRKKMKKPKVLAGIVTFNPDGEKLNKLLISLSQQVSEILVFNNGEKYPFELHDIQCKLIIHENNKNSGIGEALNFIIRYSLEKKYTHTWTFDQDSAPNKDLLQRLLIKGNTKNKIAALSPMFVDKRHKKIIFPVFKISKLWIKKILPQVGQEDLIESSLLITSGMLIINENIEKIGDFQASLFIDHVDSEWCLRANSMGFNLYTVPNAVMEHELSDGPPRRVFGRLVLEYGPIRRYYQFRNTTYLIANKITPLGLKNYFLLTLIYRFFINVLVDKKKIDSIQQMTRGIKDGLTHKLGKRI